LSPTIILFALYVQFHGDYSPGGGFQAGVIFSSAILLYALTYGLDAALKVIPITALKVCASFGVLLYAGVGVVSMLLGGNFLDYSVLASNPLTGQHIGIIIIELGVGITVASVMILLFFTFSKRVPPE
jgi:multicomponent Na+:H+ antiporter subunit B